MTDARDRLDDASAQIIEGVQRCLPGWVERQVVRILDEWGRADPETRAGAVARARAEAEPLTADIVRELGELLDTDPGEQRATPLQVVRGAVVVPTAILEAAGVPPVVRDPFDERSFPDDRYGLTPRTLGDLGDDRLAPLHLVWGLAKAALLRSR